MAQNTWRDLYKAALLEFNPEALPARIEKTRAAIGERRRELQQDFSAESLEEQRTMEDALRNLQIVAELETERQSLRAKNAS